MGKTTVPSTDACRISEPSTVLYRIRVKQRLFYTWASCWGNLFMASLNLQGDITLVFTHTKRKTTHGSCKSWRCFLPACCLSTCRCLASKVFFFQDVCFHNNPTATPSHQFSVRVSRARFVSKFFQRDVFLNDIPIQLEIPNTTATDGRYPPWN